MCRKIVLCLLIIMGVATGGIRYDSLGVADIGQAYTDSLVIQPVELKNIGEFDLTVKVKTSNPACMWTAFKYDTLAEDSSVTIDIYLRYGRRGDFKDTLIISSNDPTKPITGIVLALNVEHTDTIIAVGDETYTVGDVWGVGDPDERFCQTTYITPFTIARYEVTTTEYMRYLNYDYTKAPDTLINKVKEANKERLLSKNKLRRSKGKDKPWVKKQGQAIVFTASKKVKTLDAAATNMTFQEAAAYCNWMSVQRGLEECYSITGNTVTWDMNTNGFRLPTEIEWEYAASAGSKMVYSGTNAINDLGEYCRYRDNADNAVWRVGSRKPNAFGIYDMSGNVWEYCWPVDFDYTGYTIDSVAVNGVLRGGSRIDRAYRCRTTERFRHPIGNDNATGFRVVRYLE